MKIAGWGALAVLMPAALMAQTTNYELRLGGKTIGKDQVQIKKTKQGFQVASQYSYAIGTTEGRFSNEYRFDDTYQWLQASSSNMNMGLRYVDTLDKTRTRLAISIMQAGAGSNSELPVRPDVELLPSFDAAAAQMLLLRAVTHPTADNKYNVVVPSFGEDGGRAADSSRNDGSTPGAPGLPAAVTAKLPSSRQSYDAAWQKGEDVAGTLDGKPVTAHSYKLIFGSFHWVFIGDDSNTLLQMNVATEQPGYVLKGFVLDAKDAEGLAER